MPYSDDYIMSAHDPFVEDFDWSVDDSRHTESVSKELTETDVPRLLLFADKDVIQAMRASSSSGPAEPQDVIPPGLLTTAPRRSSGTDRACGGMS